MQKGNLMRQSDVIVLGPAGWIDAAPTIAAARAGARGFLDVEYGPRDAADSAVRRLAQFTSGPFGVKVGPESAQALGDWLREFPRLAWVLLAGGDHAELPALVALLRERGREVLFEATDLAEARRGRELGVDGLVLKGQESGGRVGGDSAFILLQRWLTSPERERRAAPGTDPALYVQGGIGLNTAGACLLAGAAGVVLDVQLLLLRESPLSDDLRQRVAAFDGSETALVGERLGAPYRLHSRPGLAIISELTAEEERIAASPLDPAEKREAWRQTVHRLALLGPERGPWLLGQDVALATPLAARSGTVASLVDALVEQTRHNLAASRKLRPLAEDAPLAKQHRTRYPILQGPMTRVSDTAAFAEGVAKGGALPFLALALLRQAETETLLRETRDALGELPWGVGILGFVPAEIRQEQLAAIRANKPPFALIAGGRPDQARELEKDGIPTYLHVPSPGLLRMFLKDGARRFIFEGRECGGHVGPRTSFVLWETMIEVLLDHCGKAKKNDDLAVVFAGGIHDARSAAMVAALAAPLAERGVAVGVLMGTAYLFTREAVECGAIMPRFQQEALACRDTVLLQTAPGHAIRCAPTPYCDDFERERRRLAAQGRSHEEIARALEWQNIGRLRLASKGLDRAPEGANGPKLVARPESDQYTRGMYMIGQVATMRDRVLTVAELHDDVSRKSTDLLGGVELELTPAKHEEPARAPCDIAIVGMAAFYPGAKNTAEFWQNILDKRSAITEVPASHWDWRLYYDPDPRARDKIISKWGGFLQDVPFDPLNYGITPNSLNSIEPLQLFLLEASRLALTDAGLDWKEEGPRRSPEPGVLKRPFPRERTAAILGIGGGGSPLAVLYGFRTCLPLLETVPGLDVNPDQVLDKAKSILPEWTEDSFPGILFNVAVGRVANRFNLGGPNYAIDAACGSSLAAIYACVRELELGTSDVAIAMGADTVQTPYAYMAFSKTHALSPKGRCRPFDAAADGIVLSEGVGAVILKRLADAVRDGDRIYAVIKGMGASSDGRDKGLTAPRAEGQLRALRRAYGQAGVSPAHIELIEAHGTGTVVGDQTEARALAQVMEETGAQPQSCAVGSVKSMIGHTKCAAGIAGLIKTAMALHRRTLPPTLVETPNPKGNFEDGPLYLNTEARPWLKGEGPRLAGVSAFGFGGTNFHAVLSEYEGDYFAEQPGLARWPAEAFVWAGEKREALRGQVEHCLKALQAGAQPALPDLAASAWRAAQFAPDRPTLAIVAASLDELKERLAAALEQLKGNEEEVSDPRGIYFANRPGDHSGAVAFLFPGQGSQYPNMLAQLAMAFPKARRILDRAQRLLAGRLDRPLSRYLYPGPAFSAEKEKAQREALTRSDVAQPAIGACSLAIFHLLESLGVEPTFLAGHSYGEFTALCAAGAIGADDLLRLSHRRGEVIRDCTHEMPGGMVALDVDEPRTAELLAGIAGVSIANSNSPAQTVVAGTDDGLTTLLQRCREKGVRGQRLPVACAFHSPLVARASGPLSEAIAACELGAPKMSVFSNVTAQPYTADPSAVAETLVEHLTSPVRFREQVEAMYAAGARVFVEVGPQAVLTGLVRQTLGDRPHLACASDQKGRPGVVQLLHLAGQLVTHGVPVRPAALFEGRGARPFDSATLSVKTGAEQLPATAWVINSVRNRPAAAPEPLLLGQPQAREAAKKSKPLTTEAPRMPAPTAIPSHPTANGDGHHPIANRPSNGKVTGLPPDAAVAGEPAQVMLRFQDLMAKFLDTQKAVMTAYLQGGPPPRGMPFPPANAGPTVREGAAATTTDSAPSLTAAPKSPTRPVGEAPTPPSAPAPAAEKPKTDRAWITAQLQDLISKRTGYPKEMLGLDIDLEADLGIDSIKRVEILAEMAQALGGGAEAGLPAGLEMEKLTAIGTLRGIIDYLDAAFNHAAPAPAKAASPANGDGKKHANGHVPKEAPPIQRAVVGLVDCPLLTSPASLLGTGAVVFTDDGEGVARDMAARLAELGRATVLLRMPSASLAGASGSDIPGLSKPEAPAREAAEGGGYAADLADAKAVKEVLTRVRQEIGPIAGLVHLLPLQPRDDELWDRRARRDTRSLYLLAKELEDDLRQAGKQGHAFLLSATSLGGAFGFGDGPLPGDYSAGQGGVLGFLKCLGQEWSEVSVRAVDFHRAGQRPSDIADRLLAELSAAEGPFEVGYHNGKRLTWAPRAAPLDKGVSAAPLVEPGAPVLITGGARGITAEIALELGRRHHPTLLLVGRSALPDDEAADTATLTTPAQVKAALIARLEREGRPPAPAAVEAAYNRLMQDREIRGNLERLRQTGAAVHYYSLDVREEAAFAALLDEVQRKYGPLAGVIHGAGVIEDRLVRSKTPESFDRVFGTKVTSARVLAERLNPERLRFLALFSSLASRYGNKGQSDYAAANEVLSKLAWQLDRQWKARVVAVAWGPWSRVGMVADLEKHLVQRGLRLISPEEGPGLLLDELQYGKKGESEVVIAGGAEAIVQPGSREAVATRGAS